MRLNLKRLWTAPVIAALALSWSWFYSGSRLKILGRDGGTSGSVNEWWAFVVIAYTLLFAITSVGVFLLVRKTGKRFAKYIWVSVIGNLFVAWFLFALAAITADPLVSSFLSAVGLASLSPTLWGTACLWMLVFLYVLFNGIDASPSQ